MESSCKCFHCAKVVKHGPRGNRCLGSGTSPAGQLSPARSEAPLTQTEGAPWPQSPLISSTPMTIPIPRTGTLSPDTVPRTGTLSPETVPRTGTLSPDTVPRTGTLSPETVPRTGTLSPETVPRTGTLSPETVPRTGTRVRYEGFTAKSSRTGS